MQMRPHAHSFVPSPELCHLVSISAADWARGCGGGRLQPLVAPSRDDGEALANVRAIAALLQGAAALAAGGEVAEQAAAAQGPASPAAGAPPSPQGPRAWQLAQEAAQLLPELGPGILFTGGNAGSSHLLAQC